MEEKNVELMESNFSGEDQLITKENIPLKKETKVFEEPTQDKEKERLISILRRIKKQMKQKENQQLKMYI